MKKLIMFFVGLITIGLMFGMVVVGSAIYDTAEKQTIETYFFQPANLSTQRVGVPESATSLGEDDVRRMLVEKFITEYFYVIPDMNNVTARIDGTMGLRWLVAPEVFQEWVATVGNEISQMAADKSMRFARLVDMQLPSDSENWWTVTYELTTWVKPNDLTKTPTMTRGVMYVNIRYEPGLRETMDGEPFDMEKWLESGKDPSLIFKFRVENVE